MEAFKMFVITDTHYFASKLGCYGEEYEKFMQFEQKCFAETQAINEAVFDFLGNSDEADTILIAGDLSFNGEKQSHLEFIELLKKCRAGGKKIFVITAGHDYNDNPFAFDDTGRIHPEGTKRDELFELYYDFGFSQAIAVDRQSLSYVAQLAPGIRLLALNNDGDSPADRTYTARQIEWILKQCEKARQENQMLIAMNHYPLLAACPLFSLVGDAVMKNADNITTLLADEGVHLCFTGHMHNQSVKLKITPNNNRLWDVCTGSVIGCPAAIRLAEIHAPKTAVIKTLPVPDFKWDKKGLTNDEYFQRQFDMMINTYLDCLADEPKRLLRKFGAADDNEALEKIMRRLGGLLNTATLGSVCKMLLVPCEDSIKDLPLRGFILEIVRNIFTGNAPYICGTPEYYTIMNVLNRFAPILRNIKIKGKKTDFIEIIKNCIGHYGVDENNCELILC